MPRQRIRKPVGPDSLPSDSAKATPLDSEDEKSIYRLDVEQLDAMHRLLGVIAAHGDVVACVQGTELAPGTLPVIGQAIYDDARALRDILEQVEMQHPGKASGRRVSVGEISARYFADQLRLVAKCCQHRLH